jgi:hypothetical protein
MGADGAVDSWNRGSFPSESLVMKEVPVIVPALDRSFAF